MRIDQLPPINVSPVTDTVQSWQYIEAQEPVDFTETVGGVGWSAEVIISNCGAVVMRAPADLTADGYVTVTIPQATGAALRSSRRIDALYQVRLTAPEPNFDVAWIGSIVVMEIIA